MESVLATLTTKLRESLAIVREAEERQAPLEEVAEERRERRLANVETSNADPLGEKLFCPFGNGLICLGLLWQNGVMTALPTLGGNNGGAFGVNNRGQLVGSTENSTKDPTYTPPQVLDFEAVVWELKQGRVKIKELTPFPGDTVGLAEGINDKGQAVGVSGVCSDFTRHAVLWQNGSVTDLGSLGSVLYSFPSATNSRGQVVGSSNLPGDTTLHAFLVD